MVDGDTNYCFDVYLRDLVGNETVRVSLSELGGRRTRAVFARALAAMAVASYSKAMRR